MIKHHPNCQLLTSYVKGELSASLSIGIAIHIEMCEQCKAKVEALTAQYAQDCFSQPASLPVTDIDNELIDMDEMMNLITANDDIEEPVIFKSRQVTFNEQDYTLPRALTNLDLGRSNQFGKISRCRVKLDEDTIHANLLHINAGGSVPEHTHKGYELTVLISGSFSDVNGAYQAGDFILLDAQHTHSPKSIEGCLCYTVADDKLHFTQGINKLLNPIGNFIY